MLQSLKEPVNETVSFSRAISYETLGKAAAIPVDTLAGATETAQAVSRFASLSKVFETVTSVAKGITAVTGAATAIKTILEMTGAIKSNMAIIQQQLAEINARLDAIQETLAYQSDLLNEIGELQLKNQLDSFFTNLEKLGLYCENIAGVYYKATNNLTTDEYYLWTPDTTQEEAAASPMKFVDVQPDTDQGWVDYLTALNAAIEAQEAARASSYKTFTTDMRNLIDAFEYVAGKVATDLNNALDSYDLLCSKTYNFDTIAKPYRMNFRTKIQFLLAEAVSLITEYYNCDNPEGDINPELTSRLNLYTNAMNKFNAKTIKDSPKNRILNYVTNREYVKFYYAYQASSLSDASDHFHAVIFVADTWFDWDDSDKPATADNYIEFTDDQINEFVRRLKSTGKTNTLAQEFELAEITNFTQSLIPSDLWNKNLFYDYANRKAVGMAFRTWKKKGAYKAKTATYYQHNMAKYIPFDGSAVQEIEASEYYPGNFLGVSGSYNNKNVVGLWVYNIYNFALQN